jgi:ferrochelatase
LQLSFHGIPERYVRAGDPYAAQCQATAAALRMRLGLAPDAIGVSFQSRHRRARRLGPYTDAVLHDLPARGVRRVQVLCPGFAVDCLETLEEIGIRYRALFLAAGGEAFDYIPALNDGADQVAALVSLVRREIAGWPGFAAEHGPDAVGSRA